MTRRDFFQAAGSSLLLSQASLPAQTPSRIQPKSSKQIAASPISIGFETLDRMMFDPERTYELLGKTGVKWARCQTGWGRTEREKGKWDFGWLDSVVDKLLAQGIQPWFNLGYGNQLYSPKAPHFSAVGWAPIFENDALAAWKVYVAKLAERFQDRVTHVEIWNEPNIPNYWQPEKPDGATYARLVAETAPVLRKHMKNVKLIGGAVAGLGENYDFIDRSMEAGLAKHIDKFSYHPYRQKPEANYGEDLRALRGLFARFNANLPLWQGENGAPSEPKGYGALADLNWTEETQAKWLLRRLLLDIGNGVEVSSYFLTVDLANYVTAKGLDGRTNFKGVLRATDYKPKKSYYALQNLCALFDSETKKADHLLRCSRVNGAAADSIHQATFTKKGAPMIAYWSASNLPDESVNATLTAFVWPNGAAMETPMLANLLTGEVTPVSNGERRGTAWSVERLPLSDGPHVFADAKAFA